MKYIFAWLVACALVALWSSARGYGFFSALIIALTATPIIAALVVATRYPNRFRRLPNGTTRPIVFDPRAPRPAFCAAMILVITLAVVAWAP